MPPAPPSPSTPSRGLLLDRFRDEKTQRVPAYALGRVALMVGDGVKMEKGGIGGPPVRIGYTPFVTHEPKADFLARCGPAEICSISDIRPGTRRQFASG